MTTRLFLLTVFAALTRALLARGFGVALRFILGSIVPGTPPLQLNSRFIFHLETDARLDGPRARVFNKEDTTPGDIDTSHPLGAPPAPKFDKQRLEKDISWLGARLREPSTYAGLAVLLAAAHIADASTWTNALTSIGVGIGGVIAIMLPES
jgi:hypothetical protein